MDVTHQRELLYRKLDALQKQGIILSPSHNVVNLNSCSSRDPSDSKDELITPSETTHPSSADFSHRRTVSYDLGQDRQTEEHIPYVSSGSSSAAPSHRIDSKNRPSLNIATGKVVPLHLSNSATNMQKRQSVSVQPVKQQLPLKLSNTFSTNGNGTVVVGQGGPQQVLPMKLALGSLAQGSQTLVANEAKNAPKRSHSAASSPSSTLTTPVHVRGGSSPALVQTTSPTNAGNVPPKFKAESSILHHLKLASDKTKNKKDDSNKEIFC